MPLPFDLNEIVAAKLAEGRREPDGLLHASGHMLGSLRHAQLDVAGAPKLGSAVVRDVRLWTGTMWHSQLDEWLHEERIPVMRNVDMTPWLPKGWGGTLDYLIFNPEYKSFQVVDLKTIKGDGMRWILRDGPKEEHIYQTSLYYHGVKKMGLPLIKQIGVYYLPMNETRDSEYPAEPILVEFDPLPEDKIFPLCESRWAKTEAYINSLPPILRGKISENEGWPMKLEDWATPALAPVQERDLTTRFDKRMGVWEAVLAPNWSTSYCDYDNVLCDCRTQGRTKVGHWLNGVWIPREGWESYPEPDYPAGA